MIAIIFIIISSFFGLSILSKLLPSEEKKDLTLLISSIILGLFLSTIITFTLNLIFSLLISITISLYFQSFICFFTFTLSKRKNNFFNFSQPWIDYLILLILVGITTYLINQSLHFTGNNILEIGGNEWGDFELHLPLIRSFSLGNNMPPSLPFFPNVNAAYHFMFDYLCAILNFGGFPLSYAFNIPSVISFTSLLFLIYKFSSSFFNKNKIIGILSIIFFIFNGTLSFVEAYQKLEPKNIFNFLTLVMTNNKYLSTGPFTSDHVSIIWNLNVYLNQRHLLFGFAVGLMLLYLIFLFFKTNLTLKNVILLAFFVGLLPTWDVYVYISICIIVGVLTITHVKQNKNLFLFFPITILLALPQVAWLSHDVKSFVQINPGFLTPHPLTISGFIIYWVYNLGFSLITIPLGFFLGTKEQKKWLLGICTIFIFGNIIQLNSVMFNNHKLFDFMVMLFNFYSAFVIYTFFSKKSFWKPTVAVLLTIFLILSGVIDFFVVKNESFYSISDIASSSTQQWISANTAQNSIFLVTNYVMYDPVRMAGRKTFVPYPRFADQFGYDVITRNEIIKRMYSSQNYATLYSLLKKNHISYVELPKNNPTNVQINRPIFLSNFPVIYSTNDFDLLAIPY